MKYYTLMQYSGYTKIEDYVHIDSLIQLEDVHFKAKTNQKEFRYQIGEFDRIRKWASLKALEKYVADTVRNDNAYNDIFYYSFSDCHVVSFEFGNTTLKMNAKIEPSLKMKEYREMYHASLGV